MWNALYIFPSFLASPLMAIKDDSVVSLSPISSPIPLPLKQYRPVMRSLKYPYFVLHTILGGDCRDVKTCFTFGLPYKRKNVRDSCRDYFLWYNEICNAFKLCWNIYFFYLLYHTSIIINNVENRNEFFSIHIYVHLNVF